MRADWVSMSRADCVCMPAFDSFGRAFIAMFRTTTGIPRSLSLGPTVWQRRMRARRPTPLPSSATRAHKRACAPGWQCHGECVRTHLKVRFASLAFQTQFRFLRTPPSSLYCADPAPHPF